MPNVDERWKMFPGTKLSSHMVVQIDSTCVKQMRDHAELSPLSSDYHIPDLIHPTFWRKTHCASFLLRRFLLSPSEQQKSQHAVQRHRLEHGTLRSCITLGSCLPSMVQNRALDPRVLQ